MMVTYALDTRTVTPHFPGIGRYVRSLAGALPAQLRDDENLLLLTADGGLDPAFAGAKRRPRVEAVSTQASPFSLRQQWAIPRLLRRHQAAGPCALLYHSPYYLMPYAATCPTVLTVYDIIALAYPQYCLRPGALALSPHDDARPKYQPAGHHHF